jgi:DNA-binding NarL/FixJ family response regulator
MSPERVQQVKKLANIDNRGYPPSQVVASSGSRRDAALSAEPDARSRGCPAPERPPDRADAPSVIPAGDGSKRRGSNGQRDVPNSGLDSWPVHERRGWDHQSTDASRSAVAWAFADGWDPLHDARILVVDDCTLYRENLAAIFAANGTATPRVAWDLPSVVAALKGAAPSVVLLSVGTRDRLMLLQAALRISPDARVIVLGVSEDDESTIVACAEAGVTGYHLRSESLDDLLMLLRRVTRGESVCSPKVSAILLRRLSVLAAERKPGPEELVLTAREIQILRMLEMGLSNRDIADQLCIALHTVKNHVHNVLGKLGVSTRAQAVAVSRSFRQAGPSANDAGTGLV